MYDLPKDIDFSEWIGRRLELVCFAEYQVFFHFERNLRISVMRSFSYQRSGNTKAPVEIEVPVAVSDLMQLLGHTIRNVSDEAREH